MKRRVNLIRIFIGLMTVILCLSILPVDAYAAKKSKKTQQVPKTEAEVLLDQLTRYRDALVKAGASAEDIQAADNAVAAQQAVIDAAKLKEAEEAAKMAAAAEAQAMYEAKQKADAEALAKAQKEYLEAFAKQQKLLEKGAKANTTGVIIIGDSRTVQMHEAVGSTGVTFIAEGGKGYDWMVSDGIPRADKLVTKGSKVVFALGVNDVRNINKYLATMNTWTYNWTARGAQVYVTTVNPVWDNIYVTEGGVQSFNQQLILGVPGAKIIDTHTFLKTAGYKMVDDFHYDVPTNTKVYLYIMSQL